MASSPAAEERAELLALLNRLRANSSLVLVALEHDDLRRLQELVQESDGLVRRLVDARPEPLPADILGLIEQLIGTNRRVVAELEQRQLEVARQLADVRVERAKVRSTREFTGPRLDAGIVDRLS